MSRAIRWVPPALAGALLAGCASNVPEPPAGPPVSALPPVPSPTDNPTTPQKVALGRQLFVDKRLSGSGTMACQSCHYREFGWTDAKALSRKDDGNLNARHTPSLYNVGYQSAWYWDGRAATLEGQVLAAWRGQIGADPAKVSALLNAVPGYASQFQAVFGAPAGPETVPKALAAYLRSVVSTDSPWDRYERGDRRAVSADAVEGFRLFTGKGRCSTCHAPPYYGNSGYYNIGLEAGKASPDPGRFAVSKKDEDLGAFKVPSLRSAALSAPHFHDGSVGTLRAAVQLMAAGGRDDPHRSPALVPTGLTESEIDKVVAFLQTLTSDEPWVAPTLP
jgi:cytochrome c peroxidase